MEVSSTFGWFEDETVLTNELRTHFANREAAPDVAGYENLREIGRGGQGIVYAGIQVSTRRLVAVKVLRDPATGSAAARRRFEREIDVVGSLHHPGIVSIHDGGITSDGRPFVVMELIDGDPIDQCGPVLALRAHPDRDGLVAVITLFAEVCDAVQYAHQHGVIHRDLKPGNLRVDRDGRACVLDFGLAKAPNAGPGVTATGTGRFVGSLPWASPEQAAGDPDAIDVRTDVYGLGMVLYNLLTGGLPFDASGSTRDVLEKIALAPPNAPSRLCPVIDHDLETVMLRAIAKEAARRYASAGAFVEDLRRWIRREPVEARRDSALYMIRATARRHRAAVASAAVIFIATVAALVVSLSALTTAREERTRATEEAKAAESAFEFLVKTLGVADPDQVGREAKIVDAVDRAAATVEERFADQPALRIRMHAALCDLYSRLGRLADAERESRLAVDQMATSAPEDAPERLALESEHALAMHRIGQTAEAAPILRRVLKLQERGGPALEAAALKTADHLANVLVALDRYDEALTLVTDVGERASHQLAPGDEVRLGLEESRAVALRRTGRLEEAEHAYREVCAHREQYLGADHTETLTCWGNLAVLLMDRGRHRDAEAIQRQTLAVCRTKYGPEHDMTLTAAANLATTLNALHELSEAHELMVETLAIRERVLGAEHPNTVTLMSNLASLELDLGNSDAAEKLQLRILEIRKRRLAPDHTDTLITLNNIAGLYGKLGRHEEAAVYYEAAVEGANRALRPDHWISALFSANFARTLAKLEKFAESETRQLAARQVLVAKLGPQHAYSEVSRKYLIELYDLWKKPAEAARWRDPAASRPATDSSPASESRPSTRPGG